MPRMQRAPAPVADPSIVDPLVTTSPAVSTLRPAVPAAPPLLEFDDLPSWLTKTEIEPMWLIPELLPAQGITIISGHQKRAKKTWLADLIAICGGAGRSMAKIAPVKRLKVLYLAGEGTPTQRRLRMQGIASSVGVIDAKEELGHVFYAWPQGVALNRPRWREDLLRVVEVLGIDLVILDSLTFLQDGDENDKQGMHDVVKTLQALQTRKVASILVMHLSGHRGEDPAADIDSQLRGSTIFANCYDTHLALRAYESQAAWIDLTARHRGYRELQFRLVWEIAGDAEGRITRANLTMEEVVYDETSVLKAATNTIAVGVPMDGRQVSRVLGGSLAALKPALDAMRQSGAIDVNEKGYIFARMPTSAEMAHIARCVAVHKSSNESKRVHGRDARS